ncbi:MAG TPA: universal stress protein [Candidatus Saccharimonadaceae bacterium]|jgi:nucleotide-binding universal stress UspA family protein|nr:universal stress protein [Candidatus Saccharimonadaceae bacterium]
MKILLGVDGSPYSKAAVDRLTKFPFPPDTEVLVLSAAQPVAVAYAMAELPAASFAPQIYEDEMRQHEEIAARFERQLKDRGFRTRAMVMRGDPRAALIDTARLEHVDMIVVGSHGRTGMTKLIMGSVANHVVTHASCDVLVVRLPATKA